MATRIHAFGPNGELSPGAAAALEGLGGGGGGSTTVQIGTLTLPEDPTEGLSVSVLADSTTVLPEGVTWDSGGEPVITERMLLVFVWSGTDWVGTYGLPIPASGPPDETGPTAGTLVVVVTSTTADGTVTGATDETDLHATPYSFRIDAGTWSAWQAGATYEWTGLTASTEYDFQHRVRDAAGNITEGAVVTDTTDAPSGDTTDPTPGTLAASSITDTGFTLTVTGAADETALHATPYAFSTNNGASWSAWQAGVTYDATGLTAGTAYDCVHKVRDAALNEATGTAIEVTTTGTAWSPADLPGLVGWFDASDAATITADGGGKVSQWDDKSGEGNHLLQATGTSQPTTGIATLNGRNVITFTSSHRMDSAAWSPWYSNGASLATSFRMTSASSFKYLVSAGSSLRIGVSEYWRLTGPESSVLDSTIDGDNSPHSIIGVNDGASSSITIDGTTQTGTLNTGAFNTIRVGTEIGAEIGEVVVVHGSLSPTDRDNLAAYLKAKWGTP